ncbi:hypothetical protein R3P38DRAFT_1642039 [Favolaschia claudopus]|uniref:PAP-associated domain-containing protein n=1 Tax=Favolaschia claudopus TaxID=2862362 RepID=A0AAW0DP88_9AGAR
MPSRRRFKPLGVRNIQSNSLAARAMESPRRTATLIWSYLTPTILMESSPRDMSGILGICLLFIASETSPKSFAKRDFTLPTQLQMPMYPLFADKKTHHFVDLNVNDRLGVMNSELIKRYCELNPVLRPMIQYIKQWAKPLGLNRSSFNLKHPSNNFLAKPITFSSYALVMMTIGFLQSRGLLPNLQEGLPPMEPGTLKGTFWLRKPRITCCDVRYNMAEGWTPPEDVPVSQLIQDWFRLWGHEFKFEEQMVSVRDGGILPRPTLADGVAPYNGVLWNLDPFIRRKNITGIISHPSLARFKFMCSEYAENTAFEEGRLPPPLTRTREEPPHIALKEKQPEPPHTPDPEWHPVDSNELPFTWRR